MRCEFYRTSVYPRIYRSHLGVAKRLLGIVRCRFNSAVIDPLSDYPRIGRSDPSDRTEADQYPTPRYLMRERDLNTWVGYPLYVSLQTGEP